MKTAARIAATILLVAAVTGAILHFTRSNTKGAAEPLTVHFTCDTAGRLEPCGCFSGQHGGLTRLRTWLEERKNPGPALKLDVGGAIAGGADYDLIQYRYLARAYGTMGFAALNMGGREAMIPAPTLASLAAVSPVPLVSASLVDVETRKPVLEPFRIVELDGIRVGILGVVSPRSVPEPGEGLAVLGLNEAIDRQLPALAAKTDLVILLAFANESEMRLLARDYFEFSLILGGDVAGPTQEILRENDSMILFTTNQARTVGTLTARVAGEKRKRLLDPKYEIQLLEEDIPQSADLLGLVREYRSEIRRTPLAIDDPHAVDPNAIPGVSATATYVGSASCQGCHPQAHEVWQKSGHGHAFETLVKRGSDADPHCIKCHTVGFGQASGYRRPLGVDSLVDVGCESCHGPASEHLAKQLHGKPTAFKFRPLGPGDCKSCHFGEFSRPFDWEKFWPGISHGKELKAGK
ncbi:MAG: multiheme c-type cytochrome [Verrucomicrobiota bacterium]